MGAIAVRAAAILFCAVLGAALALPLADLSRGGETATSLDAAFDRLGRSLWTGFGTGFALGVLATGLIGRRSTDAALRWARAAVAAIAALLTCGFAALMLSG